MLIAFYAPMKSPDHPNPSGDRRIAQLLVRALEQGGNPVHLASQQRSYDGTGNAVIQASIRQQSEKQALDLIEAYSNGKLDKPNIWLTYHLYHKSPDWIGPRVSKALKIPYIIAEASYAPKQSKGPWDLGLEASKLAIEMASAVISFNTVDDGCVTPLLKDNAKIIPVSPFIDTQPFASAAQKKRHYREATAIQHNIDPAIPWLVCVAMMRPGDKLKSYKLLGAALSKLKDRSWRLLVVGDGSARDRVTTSFTLIQDRVHWFGAQDAEDLPGIYAACDLYVWPAINEAFGMAFLEAQASGLAVIAGNSRGVSGVVKSPECGLLVEPGNSEAFSRAAATLLDEPENRRAMASRAQRHILKHHDLNAGASVLNRVLKEVTSCRS